MPSTPEVDTNTSTSTSMSTSTSIPQLSIELLIKLLPDSFDGDRYRLRSFIKQVDAVFELAKPFQISPLLLYVKNSITGKAREQIDVHCNLTTWGEISEFIDCTTSRPKIT